MSKLERRMLQSLIRQDFESLWWDSYILDRIYGDLSTAQPLIAQPLILHTWVKQWRADERV